MLFHVYDDPRPKGYFINEPFGIYRTVLDADWFLYIRLPLLLVFMVMTFTRYLAFIDLTATTTVKAPHVVLNTRPAVRLTRFSSPTIRN